MNKNIAYFGLLQFLFNPSMREAINIGMVLFSSDGKVKFKSDDTLKRIKLIYPNHDFTDISFMIKCINEKVQALNQKEDNGILDILNNGEPLNIARQLDSYTHKNILLKEGSSLLFTEISPTVIQQSPDNTLESIYNLYMGQHEKQLEISA